MALWGGADANTSAPKHKILATKADNGDAMYNNTTPGAFVNTAVKGVFGVSVAEATVADGKVTHPGWVLAQFGTGPVVSAVATGGTGYANSDLFKASGGQVNAAGTITTNSTGGITSISITNGGLGFSNTGATTPAVTNSTGGASGGSGATLTVTLGGRAGRKTYETLVAMGSLTGDGDTVFPNS